MSLSRYGRATRLKITEHTRRASWHMSFPTPALPAALAKKPAPSAPSAKAIPSIPSTAAPASIAVPASANAPATRLPPSESDGHWHHTSIKSRPCLQGRDFLVPNNSYSDLHRNGKKNASPPRIYFSSVKEYPAPSLASMPMPGKGRCIVATTYFSFAATSNRRLRATTALSESVSYVTATSGAGS